jgi:hypothetical protein
MCVHISAAAIKRAHSVNDLSPEEVANLVEQAPQPVAIGIFPRQVVRFASDPHWVHALRGGLIENADDPLNVAVFAFPTSAASFAVKQICQCREREREEQRKKDKKEEQRVTRVAAAAE